MFSTIDKSSKNTQQQTSWEQRLLKNTGRSKAAPTPEYQELKFTLHRKLVDKINLDALASMDNQKMRGEVRQALLGLIDARAYAAQLPRKTADLRRSAGRGIWAGAARAAVKGPHHIRHIW